jgi:DMSO reductase anchor subunit
MREMIFVVARKHVEKLRFISLVLAVLVPLLAVTIGPAGPMTLVLASLVHLAGAVASRWLFFAQAEHVVGLYYGKR